MPRFFRTNNARFAVKTGEQVGTDLRQLKCLELIDFDVGLRLIAVEFRTGRKDQHLDATFQGSCSFPLLELAAGAAHKVQSDGSVDLEFALSATHDFTHLHCAFRTTLDRGQVDVFRKIRVDTKRLKKRRDSAQDISGVQLTVFVELTLIRKQILPEGRSCLVNYKGQVG